MRVSSPRAHGCVVLSVDVAESARAASVDAVVELFARRSVPATFALLDPVSSPHGRRILSAHPSNEIGLLVPPAWVHGRARALVAAELTRQVAAMAAGGVRLSSLVSHSGALDVHADLLLKRGITAVRRAPGVEAAGSRWSRLLLGRHGEGACSGDAAPRLVRFGLWEFHSHATFAGAGRTVRRTIDRTTDQGRTCHVAIDAAAIVSLGRSGLAALDRMLAFVEERRAEGALAIATLAEAARRLARPRAATAESILRSRAA